MHLAHRQAWQRVACLCPWGRTRCSEERTLAGSTPAWGSQAVTPSVHAPVRTGAVLRFLKSLTSSSWPPYIAGLGLLTVFCILHALAFGALEIWGQSVPPRAGQCFETAEGHRGAVYTDSQSIPPTAIFSNSYTSQHFPCPTSLQGHIPGPPPHSPEHPGIIQTS